MKKLGDFNMTTSNPILSQFLDTFALSSLNIDSTCSKISKNPSCIHLLLANFKTSFIKINVFEIDISDHHEMISSIMKLHFKRENLTDITEITINLILITLVLNSLASQIQFFVLSMEMQTVKSYRNSVGLMEFF